MKLSIVPQGFESNRKSNDLKLVPQSFKIEEGFESNRKVNKLNLDIQDSAISETHIYMKSEMWIGKNADIFTEKEIWLYNYEEQKNYIKEIEFTPGIERIFLEIIM